MKILDKAQIQAFLDERNYDIRVFGNARWIDQKCTPDVLEIVSDCIVNFVEENGCNPFVTKDIWHFHCTVDMELLAYAGILRACLVSRCAQNALNLASELLRIFRQTTAILRSNTVCISSKIA